MELRRKEKARRQVENGAAVLEGDKLTMEEWDQAAKTRRELYLKRFEAGESTRRMGPYDRKVRINRIDTVLRREGRREMEEERERESGKGESS